MRNLFCDISLGCVQKLFVQNALDEFVSARRRMEAYRGTPTDDNAAMADSDKLNAQVIYRKFLRKGISNCAV